MVDFVIKKQSPYQEIVTVDGQTIQLPWTNMFFLMLFVRKAGNWVLLEREAVNSNFRTARKKLFELYLNYKKEGV